MQCKFTAFRHCVIKDFWRIEEEITFIFSQVSFLLMFLFFNLTEIKRSFFELFSVSNLFKKALLVGISTWRSTIGLTGCGIWLILRVGFGMRVKNRSGKRDFKYRWERDNAVLRGRDTGIVRYSMAGYGISVSSTRETLSQGGC